MRKRRMKAAVLGTENQKVRAQRRMKSPRPIMLLPSGAQ